MSSIVPKDNPIIPLDFELIFSDWILSMLLNFKSIEFSFILNLSIAGFLFILLSFIFSNVFETSFDNIGLLLLSLLFNINISSEPIFISKGNNWVGNPASKLVRKWEYSKSSIVAFEETNKSSIFDGLSNDNCIFEEDKRNNWIRVIRKIFIFKYIFLYFYYFI